MAITLGSVEPASAIMVADGTSNTIVIGEITDRSCYTGVSAQPDTLDPVGNVPEPASLALLEHPSGAYRLPSGLRSSHTDCESCVGCPILRRRPGHTFYSRMENAMRSSLRSLFTLPALCIVLSASLWPPLASAQSGEEAVVTQAVEALRKAMFARDPKQFEELISEKVSYGHSAGRIENKKQFIDAALANKSVMKSLTFTDQTVQITGDHAVVRNTYNGVSELDGKTNNTKIGVLMVWAKEGNTWRLYARQAYRL